MDATGELRVDPSNADQARAWNGHEGTYWSAHADRFDRAMAPYHQRLLDAAALTVTDRVLDIGCGAGQTTLDAARVASDGGALGVDLSSQLLDVAQARASAAGLTNVTFVRADAQVHPFDAESFDVAISRTGAMFFGDPVAAFTNIGRALVPGGRMVLVAWQPLSENEWIRAVVGALAAGRDLPGPPAEGPGPFALSDPDVVRRLLTRAGFTDVELDGTTAGMWFGADADDAQQFVLGLMVWMLDGLDDAGRARALDALHATMGDHRTSDGVVLGSAAWTITATRPGGR